MLKSLAIHAILALGVLAFAQDSVPPNGSQQHDHPQANIDTGQPKKPTLPTSEGNRQNSYASQENAENESKAMKYLEDAFAAANLSNWVLAGLGIIGGIVAVFTLRLIKRQANTMDKQAADARESSEEATRIALATAKAAQQSAYAANSQVEMIKRKERARLVVRAHAEPGPGFVIEDDQGHTIQALDVRIEIANEGETGAFNVSATGRYVAVPVRDSCDISSGFKLDIPTIIRPATPESHIVVSIDPVEGDIASISADDGEAIQRGSKALHVFGIIRYDDVFDDRWGTPFHFIWRTRRYGEDAGDVEANWEILSLAGGPIGKDQQTQNPN